MYVEEDNYEYFKNEKVNNLSKLNYDFILNKRFIDVKDNNEEYFQCQTPFLRVLKPNHITLNRKKTIANKYIILEINDELDFNNQIGDFLFIINKIHEVSQEKIKNNSMKWFKTEFDEIGLDIKVRRPINEQKENEFIKICIPKNKEIEDRIDLLTKGDYILCNIIFKGLKVSNDYITEEWELSDFITQEKYEEMQNIDLLYNEKDNNLISTILDEEINMEESLVKNDLEEMNVINDMEETLSSYTNVLENSSLSKLCTDKFIVVENNVEDMNVSSYTNVPENSSLPMQHSDKLIVINNIEETMFKNDAEEMNLINNMEETVVKNDVFIEKNKMKDIENNSVTETINNTFLSETKTSKNKIKKHKIIKKDKKILYM